MIDTFSERHGYSASEPDITVREDAPDALRGAVAFSAQQAGMDFNDLRRVVCQTLAVAPDTRGNWSERNVMEEVHELLQECEWFEVYDVIEALACSFSRRTLLPGNPSAPAGVFARAINRVFRRDGIGWQLIDGRIEMRGSETFEVAVREGRDELRQLGKRTTANELHEALRDLSRRPRPELTGAIQHGVAALECLSKDLTGDKSTLGALVKNNPTLFPAPLGDAIAKVYGFASENGRHLREGQEPSFEEAELVVGLSGVLCRYMGRKVQKS